MSLTPRRMAEKNGWVCDWDFAENAYSRTIRPRRKQTIMQTGYDRQEWILYECKKELMRGTFARCMKGALAWEP